MTTACRFVNREAIFGAMAVTGRGSGEVVSRIMGCTIRFGEYVFMTLAAGGVQTTWERSHPRRAEAMAEKYGAPV